MLSLIQVEKVIPLFERMYPGVVAEFFFDQSSAHGAFTANQWYQLLLSTKVQQMP